MSDKFKIISKLKELYENKVNIIEYLRELENNDSNDLEDIMISYDLQAGKYIQSYQRNKKKKDEYCHYLADIINNLCNYSTILEVGVGEATTMVPMIKFLNNKACSFYGFDISWSRIKYAKNFAKQKNVDNLKLFVGDLFNVPLKNNSIDIVYTSHSIEPNGGKEEEALKELYRVVKKYLILLEPSYEFASDNSRRRMKKHGYITDLYSSALELGYEVIVHRLFEVSLNPLNPTGIMIIKKSINYEENNTSTYCCPVTKTQLIECGDSYYSTDSMLAYPVLKEIPCLLPQHAIVASKYLDEEI